MYMLLHKTRHRGDGDEQGGFLRRGAVGGGALLVSASGLSTFGSPRRLGRNTSGRRPRVPPPPGRGRAARARLPGEGADGGKLRHDGARVFRRIQPTTRRTTRSSSTCYGKGNVCDRRRHRLHLSEGQLRAEARSQARRTARAPVLGAYVGALENVQTPQLRLPIGQIAANEAQHQGALAALRGKPVIGKAFAPALQIGAVTAALDDYES